MASRERYILRPHTIFLPPGFDTQLMCSKGQTPNGHTEIKCDTARRGNILTVAINLQPTAIVKCSLYTFTEFGVIVKCFSSLFKIHGMAYFINGLPISVTCKNWPCNISETILLLL